MDDIAEIDKSMKNKIKYNQNCICLNKYKRFFSPVNKFTSTDIAELLGC